MDSVHIGTQACSLQSSLKLCKLYFCTSVFSMRLFVGSFAQEPPVHTTVCPVSPSMNVHNKKKQSKMLWNLILLKNKCDIWWFKWCLHLTLTSRSSAHALQMSNAINPSSKARFTQHDKRWKHSAAVAFSHFGCVLYSQDGARVMDSRRTLP